MVHGNYSEVLFEDGVVGCILKIHAVVIAVVRKGIVEDTHEEVGDVYTFE